MERAILVQGLGKRFRRYHPDRPRTFQEAVLRGLHGLQPEEEFWALREIDLNIPRGQMVGVIGQNGAGKSTLLRLIGGVGRPDEGRVIVSGRIGALIDLGAGFHPDLTGRENIFVNGVISGLTRREVSNQFAAIVDFAELAEFIDSPIRTYSTGMQMRLAFAIAIHVQPEILLIDEVLAVGDVAFQNKCLERISQFKAQGVAILLVSHDTSLVSRFCDEVIWLDKGQVAARGEAQDVVGQYLVEMEAETRRRTPASDVIQTTPDGVDLKLNENRFGTQEMTIEAVRMRNALGEETRSLQNGETLAITIDYSAPEPITAPIFGVTITRGDGLVCWDGSTHDKLEPTRKLQGMGSVSLTLDRLDLSAGKYFVDVGIYHQDWEYAYDYHWRVYSLEICAHTAQKGLLLPPHSWKFLE